jgi:prepilin-type processing-associated H-X9-DG protein
MNIHGEIAQLGAKIGTTGRYYPWITGWLSWDASPHNSNEQHVISPEYAVLAKYTASTKNVYRCPADKFVSRPQRMKGWKERVRSVSMNGAVGEGNKAPTDGLLQCEKLFIKASDVTDPTPSRLWVLLDEHPDSINDGCFFNAQGNGEWIDLPGNLHSNANGFAFADGHSEIHKWRTSVSKYRLRFEDLPRQGVSLNDPDFRWVLERTSAPRPR